MPDVASEEAGGRVVMVSSLDLNHPGENVIEANERTYWISTGLFPQEIILELCRPSRVSSVKIVVTHVRSVRIEGAEESPVNFQVLAEEELDDKHGGVQVREMQCRFGSGCNTGEEGLIEFIRVSILSAWHDFASVHRVHVEGEPIGKRRTSVDGGSPARAGELSVSIPAHREHARRADRTPHDEPDAPRQPADTTPWNSENGVVRKSSQKKAETDA